MLYTNKHHEYTSHVSLHHLFSATGYLLTVYWIEIEIPWHVCVLGTMYLSKRMMNCSLDTTTIVTASVAAVWWALITPHAEPVDSEIIPDQADNSSRDDHYVKNYFWFFSQDSPINVLVIDESLPPRSFDHFHPESISKYRISEMSIQPRELSCQRCYGSWMDRPYNSVWFDGVVFANWPASDDHQRFCDPKTTNEYHISLRSLRSKSLSNKP